MDFRALVNTALPLGASVIGQATAIAVVVIARMVLQHEFLLFRSWHGRLTATISPQRMQGPHSIQKGALAVSGVFSLFSLSDDRRFF